MKGEDMEGLKKILISTVIFFATVGFGYGADVAKIGIVDFQKILRTSSAGKKAQIEINKKGQAMEAELKTKGDSIKSQQESFNRESLVMSREMREQKERELRIMINDFKTLQKKYMNEFNGFEKQIVQSIRNEIQMLVEALAKKEGYLLVLEKREGGLLYYPNTLELTDKIIMAYNAKIAAGMGKDPAAGTQ